MGHLSLNLKNLRTLGEAQLSSVQGGTGGIYVPTTYDESVGCDPTLLDTNACDPMSLDGCVEEQKKRSGAVCASGRNCLDELR